MGTQSSPNGTKSAPNQGPECSKVSPQDTKRRHVLDFTGTTENDVQKRSSTCGLGTPMGAQSSPECKERANYTANKHTGGRQLKPMVTIPKCMVFTMTKTENRQQRTMGLHARHVGNITPLTSSVKRLVFRAFLLVKGIRLLVGKDRASHQSIRIANLGAVPHVIETTLPGAKLRRQILQVGPSTHLLNLLLMS